MAEDIPFDKTFDLAPGIAQECGQPGSVPVRRVLCNNPSPFTFKGTVSYIIGRGKVAIVDPGPEDQNHLEALLNAVKGEAVTHIFVTHTHRDHSPNTPALKAATGATVLAEGPHRHARALNIGENKPLDASGDVNFMPDRRLKDGEVVQGDNWAVEAIFTPGHCANHMAYALRDTNMLFVGDHVMKWATSIVAPPDGAMSDYMASLDKLARRKETIYFPGHGREIENAPAFVAHYIEHRKAREASILHRLAKGEADIPTLVRAIYIGIDPRLTGAAGMSILAHMEDLVARGQVTTEGAPSIAGTYFLAG